MLQVEWESGILTDAERNYSTLKKKYLAVVQAMLTLCPYLYGFSLTLCTDQETLFWLLNLDDASGRLAQWRLRLVEY